MKKIIFIVCLGLILTGCQQRPSSQNGITAERQEAAKKLFAQSILLLQQKNLKGAVASLEASIKIDPSDPNPYLLLGQILLKAQQYKQAEDFLDQTAKAFPNNGTVFYMLSIADKMTDKKLPAVLAARRSYEIFKAQGDSDNIKSSAVLVEELIKDAQTQEDENAKASAKSPEGKKAQATKPLKVKQMDKPIKK